MPPTPERPSLLKRAGTRGHECFSSVRRSSEGTVATSVAGSDTPARPAPLRKLKTSSNLASFLPATSQSKASTALDAANLIEERLHSTLEPLLSTAIAGIEERVLMRMTALETRSERNFAQLNAQLSSMGRNSSASWSGSGRASYSGGASSSDAPTQGHVVTEGQRAGEPGERGSGGGGMSAHDKEEVQHMDTLIQGDSVVQNILKELREKCEKRIMAPHVFRRDRFHNSGREASGRLYAEQSNSRRTEPNSPASHTTSSPSRRRSMLRRAGTAFLGTAKPSRWWKVELCLGKVMHPEGRFRSLWNVALAFLILYCGVSVPLEIAMEKDLLVDMCASSGATMTFIKPCFSW